MDVSSILLNTQNPDVAIRSHAEEQLNSALQTNMAQFMITLTQALAAETFDPIGRQAAGLYLKNVLDAKDARLQAQKAESWLQMDEGSRSQIKQMALQVLHSQDVTARHTGAQLVAKIGAIEVPAKKWPDLLPSLLLNVTNGSEGTQHATLEALGYLCEELDDDKTIEQDDTNKILTAIVDGIRADRPTAIRHAAVTALRNSLDFISENFKREQERNHIMQVVCEATQCPDIRVRVVAFECIASIASIYYEELAPYMQALYNVTFKAVREDDPEVGLQSLEFWSTVCDVEIDIADDAEYQGITPSENDCKFFIKQIRTELIPLLTETLKHQDEDQDEDTWNISMAGATCLGLVAQAIGDDCVDLTMTFINLHISSTNWREKEAAIMAFGSILDGPSPQKVAPLVENGIAFLIQCMGDQNLLVRDTTAWAIGRICELHPLCIGAQHIAGLMTTFLNGLNDDPRVAHNICYAIHNLAKAFESEGQATNYLSPYFSGMFDKLLETANRPDWSEHNLRGASYEALNMLVQVAATDVSGHVLARVPVILERLESTFHSVNAGAASHQDEHHTLQALLCGLLLVTIQKLPTQIIPFADRIMECLLQVFNSRNATADEEAFMSVGALANCLNEDFVRYMTHFGAPLIAGLNNSEEFMVCTVAVGVVGDLCRALNAKMKPYCDEIVALLLRNLQNHELNRAVKPPVISCFGDIALAIEGDFDRYVESVMPMLDQATNFCKSIDADDPDTVDYLNQLRESLLEAYTGIIQGLGAGEKSALVLPYVARIGDFIQCLAIDRETRNEAVTCGCAGLVGDLAHTLGSQIAPIVKTEYVLQILRECNDSHSPNSQSVGAWAQQVIQQL